MEKKSGVYTIRNIQTGKQYLGSSENLQTRWWNHRRCLRKHCHQNTHLQRSWDLYGESCFIFEILEECAPEQCRTLEQRYLDMSDSDRLYNIARDAFRGAGKWGRLGKTNSPEHRAAISRSLKGMRCPTLGMPHTWAHKAGETIKSRLPFFIRATQEDGTVLEFRSARDAAKELGCSRESINNCLSGRARRVRSGWRFVRVPKEA